MPFIVGSATTAVTSYLLKQVDSFIENFGLITALGVVLYFVLQKWIEHGFQKKSADYQAEIQTKLESLKLDHQKVLFNFESFNSKQNERFPELYTLIETALGHIRGLRGYKRLPTFENVAEEDVKTYCEAIEMNSGDVNRILSIWESQKDFAITEIRRLKKTIDYNRAEIKWFDANDYLIYNELYFSDQVAEETRKLLDLMYRYWLNLDPIYQMPIYAPDLIDFNKENEELKIQIDEQRATWKTIIKKEVSGQNAKKTS
ncbi:hypothetical protein [Gottfriedia acidiceleris]|uniref:hypothetical protein n=1 Tax=Gottfriedia acidiceleris TaxID=371036 RepID=UPI002FFE1880